MPEYVAVAERDEAGWWAIRVEGLPGVFTQCREASEIVHLVEDAIALAQTEGLAPAGPIEFGMRLVYA